MEDTLDLGVVTTTCICGSTVWKLLVQFDDNEISWYTMSMFCYGCGSKAIAPTPIDYRE